MKTTTININGTPFTYNDEIDDISYETISAISQDEAKRLLQTVKRLFEAKGIKYCLGFGTLLGVVRDGQIISGDEDVDIIVESKESILNNLFYFADNGLSLCRFDNEFLFSFRANTNSYVDVYFRYPLPLCIWKIWCVGLANRVMPRKLFQKYDSILFFDDTYPIPHKPERLLKFWYGTTWRTPVRGHSFTYDTPLHYWWINVGRPRYYKIRHYCSFLFKPKFLLNRVKGRIRGENQ